MTPAETVSNAVLLQKINELFGMIERVERMQERQTLQLDAIDTRLRSVEQEDIRVGTINQQKIDAMHRRLDQDEVRLDRVENAYQNVSNELASIKTKMNIITGIGTLLLASAIGIIIQILTHGGSLLK